MLTTQTVPQVKDTAIAGELFMSFELGDKSWKVTASDGRRGPSHYNVDAGDTAEVAHCIGKGHERFKLEPQAKVHCCKCDARCSTAKTYPISSADIRLPSNVDHPRRSVPTVRQR